MRLYNTLTRRLEAFAPTEGNTVRMYTCGLTVYARGHIGNFRTFVCLDVLRRTLRHLVGFEMKQVMNFTDVDDRTIAESRKAGMELRDLHRTIHPGVSRGRADAGARAGRGHATRDRRREPARDGGDDPGARSQRPYLQERWIDLLQDLHVRGIRQARPPRSPGHSGGRAHRCGQVREGRCPRLRALEGDEAR